jgi:hypothetical protein
VTQTLRRAQTLAQSNVDASPAGVYLCANASQTGCTDLSTSIILFRRGSFIPYDASHDDVFEVAQTVTFTGALFANMLSAGGIVFGQLTGEPNVTGILTILAEEESATLTLNAKGAVEY